MWDFWCEGPDVWIPTTEMFYATDCRTELALAPLAIKDDQPLHVGDVIEVNLGMTIPTIRNEWGTIEEPLTLNWWNYLTSHEHWDETCWRWPLAASPRAATT